MQNPTLWSVRGSPDVAAGYATAYLNQLKAHCCNDVGINLGSEVSFFDALLQIADYGVTDELVLVIHPYAPRLGMIFLKIKQQ